MVSRNGFQDKEWSTRIGRITLHIHRQRLQKAAWDFLLEIVALGSGYLKYDVVPICLLTGALDVPLTPQNFRSERTKKNMDDLLEGYFHYIADLLKPVCQETFESALSYCSTLRKYDVACEVIAYDLQPLESAYGRSLTF